MIQGVLFDLDGVIADTLHYHYLAWQHMFESQGGSIREMTVLLHEGRKSIEILPILMKESGVHIPKDQQEQFIEEKRAFYRTIVRVSHFPKAFDVVNVLKRRGFQIALVTACALQNMQHTLNLKQQSYFDFILTGDEVEHAKPLPEPYLKAAERLGLSPDTCVVVENAPLGIESAKAAGMQCIAIETTLDRTNLQSADYIVKTIGELIEHPIFAR